ncbi:MAG: right-handed parallel beta-helix repeat-containing protein [Candidatus Heimdallarchaeaceae archaeon]
MNDAYGQIIINNSTNIIVADQTMAKLTSGLIVYNSKNTYLHNVTILNATLEAIGIMNCENISLHEITVLGNDILELGLRAYNVIFLKLNYSRISSTKDTAFYLEECANITISYNIFDHGGDYGLYLYDCSNATVFGNDFFHSDYDLISDESGNNNLYYHPLQKFGNCYDDWNGSDSYRIGSYPDAIFDLYPINDTDADGLNDSLEVYHHLTDPFLADTDKDGLPDNEEISNHHTDPTKDDTDSDGMPDGWEIDNNLNPIVDDSAVDTDNDGLTNLEEFEAGTNPQNNDTDSDGMPDGWEIDNNLNPTIDDSADDADNDGLTNLEEYNHGTNPHLADTDGDGYTDYEEIIAGTDPLNSQEFPEEEPSNIGIVIGISIGASVLIVGIVIFLIKKKVLLSKNKRK